jgi:hypothetical protein
MKYDIIILFFNIQQLELGVGYSIGSSLMQGHFYTLELLTYIMFVMSGQPDHCQLSIIIGPSHILMNVAH